MIKLTARQQKRLKFLTSPRFIGSLPKVYIQVLELLFRWDNHQNSFKAYQAHIADRVGCTREYICTVLGDLEFWGFIYTKRIYDTYKIYCINRYFHQEEVRRSLSFLFETFWHWPKRYLFSLCLLTSIILPFSSYIYLEAAAANSYSIDSKRGYAENKISSENKKSYSLVNKAVPKKGKSLMTFTKEQMEQISKAGYSNEAISHATKELAASKNIADPFRYFKAICHRFDTQPQKATPQTKPINAGRLSGQTERERYRIEETNFTFCVNSESNLHSIIHKKQLPRISPDSLEQHTKGVANMIGMLDAVLSRLTEEERENIFKSQHTSDCKCRELFPFKGIKKEIAAPPTPPKLLDFIGLADSTLVDNAIEPDILSGNEATLEKETNESTRNHSPSAMDRTNVSRLYNSTRTDTISPSTPRKRPNMGSPESPEEYLPSTYEPTEWQEIYD